MKPQQTQTTQAATLNQDTSMNSNPFLAHIGSAVEIAIILAASGAFLRTLFDLGKK
ncbi:MAG: hypothetical protein ACK54J_06370 [Pseudanabaena sp.]|jgi:hypothetical protein